MTNPVASQQPAPKDYRSYLRAGGNEPFDVWADGRIDELENALQGLIGLGRPARSEWLNDEAYRSAVAQYDYAVAALGTPGKGEK